MDSVIVLLKEILNHDNVICWHIEYKCLFPSNFHAHLWKLIGRIIPTPATSGETATISDPSQNDSSGNRMDSVTS